MKAGSKGSTFIPSEPHNIVSATCPAVVGSDRLANMVSKMISSKHAVTCTYSRNSQHYTGIRIRNGAWHSHLTVGREITIGVL